MKYFPDLHAMAPQRILNLTPLEKSQFQTLSEAQFNELSPEQQQALVKVMGIIPNWRATACSYSALGGK